MNTIWHIFWTWAVFRKKSYAIKPILFAIIPDLPWLFGLIFSLLFNGINFEAFLQGYYYIPIIYLVFFFHSFFIVSLFFAAAILLKKKSHYPYFFGWYFHIFLDYATHVSDAYPIFWPFSNFSISSIISYWERSHYSFELAIFNIIVATIFIGYLIFNKKEKFNKLDLFVSISLLAVMLTNLIFFFTISGNRIYLILNFIPVLLNIALILKILRYKKKKK